MSKSVISKASAILTGISILAMSVFPVIAEDSTSGATIKRPPIRQKINIRQEKVASRTAALKTRLEAFKDRRKAEIAERVNTNLNTINQNQTTQMQKSLGTMSSILDRLEARVNQQRPDIKDPVAALAAIATARTTIATTSATVTAQAEKDYTVQVTSESRIKADVKAQRDKLHTDLKAVRKNVIDAKQAVVSAVRIAKSGTAVKEGTNSGQQ